MVDQRVVMSATDISVALTIVYWAGAFCGIWCGWMLCTLWRDIEDARRR